MLDPKRIWSSSQLPTLPSVAIRLLQLSKDPETEIKQVVAVIKTDPAISAKILKSANSSLFGLTSKVTSVDRAVPLLGTTVVTSLALSFSLVESAMTRGKMVEHYNTYWLQSVVQGLTAEMLSKYSKSGLDCEFFLAGLLMDLGRLALLKTVPNEYHDVLEQCRELQRELHEVEAEQLGFNHVDIGTKLMENWSLPPALIQAVERHHAPVDQILESAEAPASALANAVAVAGAVGDYFCAANKADALERLRQLTTALFGFSAEKLDEFLQAAKSRVDEGSELFSANTDTLREPGELMAEANEHLSQLALRAQVESSQAAARRQVIEQEKLELESQNQELKRRALYDPLTKIYNRHFFEESLEKELSRCQRTATPIGVIFADIDKFKQLNDTYGHQFGDTVLERVAQTFAQILRTSDVVARYGGEEFVGMVHEPTEKGMQRVCERFRAAVEAQEILFDDQHVPVTVSLGAAITVPDRSEQDLARKIVAEADQAMYDSKRNGRNQFHLRLLMKEQERRLAQAVLARRFSRWLVERGEFDIPTISQALTAYQHERAKIGTLARQHGFLTQAQVDEVLAEQKQTNQRFGEIAIGKDWLSEEQLAQLLAVQQEDPVALAKAVVLTQLMEHSRVAALVREYLAETMPHGVAVAVEEPVAAGVKG